MPASGLLCLSSAMTGQFCRRRRTYVFLRKLPLAKASRASIGAPVRSLPCNDSRRFHGIPEREWSY